MSAGIALSAGSAFAGGPSSDIFDGDWYIDDSKEPNTVECAVFMNGNDLGAYADAIGTGTGGQGVEIFVDADEPTSTSRDTTKGKVAQSRYSFLGVYFDAVPAVEINVEKCKVSVIANSNNGKGSGEATCKGENLNALLTADQVGSIQTAFANSDRVKFKANANNQNWSLSIKCNGEAFED